MQHVRGFGRFWWDFIIGDDPVLAVGVVLVLALARIVDQSGLDAAAWVIGPIGARSWLFRCCARSTLTESVQFLHVVRPRASQERKETLVEQARSLEEAV